MAVRNVLRNVTEITVTLSFHQPSPNPMSLRNRIFAILNGASFDSFKTINGFQNDWGVLFLSSCVGFSDKDISVAQKEIYPKQKEHSFIESGWEKFSRGR